MYVHTNLVCIESETSDVESASNPTKSLQKHGRAQEGSSELVGGKVHVYLFIDCAYELLSTCTYRV